MKILWLYKYIDTYDFDHHLHMSYAKFLSTFPGVTLKAYGPNLHIGYPLINLTPFNSRLRLSDLHKLHNFDVVIVNTKSRCWDHYNPHLKEARGCWLPADFTTFKCPKIMIEEDYHYETDDNWYRDYHFDLILQRHHSQSLRTQHVPMKFHPFSVDIATFNSWKTECIHRGSVISLPLVRNNKIAMIGSCGSLVYKNRKNVSEMLSKAKLGVNWGNNTKVDGEYIKILREYVAYVSCGSIYHICAAKNYEIMSSGGLLFTDKFNGIDEIFPSNSYCSYQDNYTDVIAKANKILNEPDYVSETISHARECIHSRHTHDIRTKELIKILREMK